MSISERIVILVPAVALAIVAISLPTGSSAEEYPHLPEGCDGVVFSDFDVPPAMVDSIPPIYNPDWDVCDSITVAVDVLETGEICKAQVVSEAFPAYRNAAIEAASTSLFMAALRDGNPVPGRRMITYVFEPHDYHREPAQLRITGTMVSSLADSFWQHSEHGDRLPTFKLNGILVTGDISTEVLDQALAQLDSEIIATESPNEAIHFLAFPEDLRRCEWKYVDLLVRTSSHDDVLSGHRFDFVNENGVYRLVRSRRWVF